MNLDGCFKFEIGKPYYLLTFCHYYHYVLWDKRDLHIIKNSSYIDIQHHALKGEQVFVIEKRAPD